MSRPTEWMRWLSAVLLWQSMLNSALAFSPLRNLVSKTPALQIGTGFGPRSSAPLSVAKDPFHHDSMNLISTTAPSLRDTDDETAGALDQGVYIFNKLLVDTVYNSMNLLYPSTEATAEKEFARFFVLETVARVPYFAYLSVLHLKETFGLRYEGMSERMRAHYAEADNELHHLLIMESLGGNQEWFDRALAHSMAFAYYWYVVVVYLWNESAAYHLSELIENHAYDTYDSFLERRGEELKVLPVPDVARKYYETDSPCLLDLFCTVEGTPEGTATMAADHPIGLRKRGRPHMESLFDVFVNIRDDEKEHWQTLCNLVQHDSLDEMDSRSVRSTQPTGWPSLEDWFRMPSNSTHAS